MSKKKLIKVADIKKILNESVFDPNINSPLALIVQTHLNDPSYLESRAIEMIGDAKITRNDNPVDYHEKMKKAIALLAIARLIINLNPT